MSAGFIRAPHGIQWRNSTGQPLRWNWIGNALPNTLDWWTFAENRAWRCVSCNMLIIDHSQKFKSGKAATL